MKLPYPKTLSDFPLYIVFYWIILWGIILFYGITRIVTTLTPDGKYVKKVECVKIEKRKDEEICIEYKKPYYTPVGYEITRVFVGSGIIVGAVSLGIGYSLMVIVWRKQKSYKRR